jgi:hypothetical protein
MPVAAVELLPAAGLAEQGQASIATAEGDKVVSGTSKAVIRTPEGLAYHLSLSEARREGTRIVLPDGMALDAATAPTALITVASPSKTIALVAGIGGTLLAGTLAAIAVSAASSSPTHTVASTPRTAAALP